MTVPIFGCVTEEEADEYASSNGLLRSTDGGMTWNDFLIFRPQPKRPNDIQPEPRYSETDVVGLGNGHWGAFTRREEVIMGPGGWGLTQH